MGKNEFLTPKWLSNGSKAIGLQKLRWYFQMCNKQCQDENRFKCHCISESRQRQMYIFAQNPNGIVARYSQDLERSFLDNMKRSHRSSRVAATIVYNKYIADRHHVHMNSTQWATLTEFVKYLGSAGKCKVDDTPKGWCWHSKNHNERWSMSVRPVDGLRWVPWATQESSQANILREFAEVWLWTGIGIQIARK